MEYLLKRMRKGRPKDLAPTENTPGE